MCRIFPSMHVFSAILHESLLQLCAESCIHKADLYELRREHHAYGNINICDTPSPRQTASRTTAVAQPCTESKTPNPERRSILKMTINSQDDDQLSRRQSILNASQRYIVDAFMIDTMLNQ